MVDENLVAGPVVSGSREIGMAMYLRAARYFLATEDLHYGYWPDGLAVHVRNLAAAQEAYTEELMADFPPDVETVLDVGCGSGATARRLLERHYRVDCVSHPGPLAGIAAETLGDRATLFECPFQDLETERRYDLILFSESLLFIRPLRAALTKAASLTSEGGHILVSDLFRRLPPGVDDVEGLARYHAAPLGGGHYLRELREMLAELSLEVVRETDITARIAPTFTVLEQILEVAEPIHRLWMERLRLRHPWLLKLGRAILDLDKYERKYFGGRYSAENFLRHKTYWRFLIRPDPGETGEAADALAAP